MKREPIHWIVCPVRNGLYLTQKAFDTFMRQDVGITRVLLINNDSRDGTFEWATANWPDIVCLTFKPRLSVAQSWNRALEWLWTDRLEYALVVNNDVELRPDTYRWLVEDGGEFVTGIGVDNPKKILPPWNAPDPAMRRPHPDFSCFLMRRSCWDKVGPFNEAYQGAYAEDCDYHVRLYRAGVKAYCLNLPFYHVASGTLKNMSDKDREELGKQADHNRALFEKDYGVKIGSDGYKALFKEKSVDEKSTSDVV